MRRFRCAPRRVLLLVRIATLVVSSCMLAPQNGGAADPPKLVHPVMMDSNGPGTELYVLDDAGVLHKFRVAENGLSEYGAAALPSNFKPADMTFAQSEKPASILVAGLESARGRVALFSLDGRSLKEWAFQNVCSGVDSGKSNHLAYVATSDSNEIYRVDMQGARINPVAHIDSAAKLGPVALDEKHQQIYVADIAGGKIFQLSLESRKSKVFVTGLSAPSALVYDADTDRLFVADPGQQAVFTVDALNPNPVIARFASGPLRSPYGMTLIANGRVAVADYNSNAVFVFSGKGEVMFRYPAERNQASVSKMGTADR